MGLPLEGVTVLDLSQIYNGPYATFMLAQAGADIIKVEPLGGEHLRRRGVVGGAALPLPEYLENIEKQAILDALEKTGNNKTAAAKLLGVSFRTLRYRLSKLGLSKEQDLGN